MNDLGKLEKFYKMKWQSKIAGIFLGIFGIFGGGGFIYEFLFTDWIKHKDNPLVFIFVFGIGVVIFLMGILGIYGFFRMRKDNVYLYENGLVQNSKGKIYIVKWNEIEGLYESVSRILVNGIPSREMYSYTVKKYDGEKLILGDILNGIKEIGLRLKEEVLKRRFPVIIERFNRGETIKFDRFSLNQSHLFSEKREELPLSNIGEISINNGNLTIRKKDSGKVWDSDKYSLIPNASILMLILENFR